MIADAGAVRITADPELNWVLPFLPSRGSQGELHLFSLSGSVTPGTGAAGSMAVRVAGRYRQADTSAVQQNREWLFAKEIVLSVQDRELLSSNTSHVVQWASEASQPTPVPQSFWESTLEPALVVIGAGAIVALFFLIRS